MKIINNKNKINIALKEIVTVFVMVCLMLYLSMGFINAHSGGTDANGGHLNHSTGEYHYHHGYPEHQHPNGICPYESNSSEETVITYNAEDDFDDDEEEYNEYANDVSSVFSIEDNPWILVVAIIIIIVVICKKASSNNYNNYSATVKQKEDLSSLNKTENNKPIPVEELRVLKDLFDDGILTEEEYIEKKRKLLGL